MRGGARAAVILFAAFVLFASVPLVAAQSITPPDLKLAVEGIGGISAPLQLVLVLTLLSFVPAILVIMTCFTRIVIVFHFLRQALGTQEMPSNQVIIGLTVFLTMFVMAPVATRQINEVAVQPAIAGKVSDRRRHSRWQRRPCATSCSSRRARPTSRCSWS